MNPRYLKPGTMVRHKPSGKIDVLDRRKEDDTGWWLRDHGGLVDWIIERGEVWELVGPCPVCGKPA